MKVMYGLHSRNSSQFALERNNVDVSWCPFEKNIYCVADEDPRTRKYQDAYKHADRGVGGIVAGEKNDDAGDDGAGGTNGIADDVKHCTTDIQTMVVLAKEQVRAQDIGHESDTRHDEHPAGFYFRWIREPMVC